MHRVTASICLTVTLLSGCAAYQQHQAQADARERTARIKQALDDAKARCTQLYSDSAIDPIRGRIVIDHPETASLAQMSDPSLASPSDLPAIDAFETARRKCGAIFLNVYMGNLEAPFVSALERAQATSWDLSRDLYARKITFGAFNTGRADGARQLSADIHNADTQVRENAIEQQREADERQRDRQSQTLAILGATMASHPAPPVQYVPVPPPIIVTPAAPVIKPVTITNCNALGSTLNCTTY